MIYKKNNNLSINLLQKSLKWRTQLKNSQLVTQISTILLQKQNWQTNITNIPLNDLYLTPKIYQKILKNTQKNPLLSLSFFTFAKSNLAFKPDLKTLIFLIKILNGPGLVKKQRPILDLLINTYPVDEICEFVIFYFKDSIFCKSSVLSSVLEYYCKRGDFLKGLEVYKKSIDNKFFLSIFSCNSLLGNLELKNEKKLFYELYCNMLRNRVLIPDNITWSILAKILCNDGKFEIIVRILNMGIYNCVIYDLVIEFYSKKGEFKEAFSRLNEMHDRAVKSSFCTYSSVLDGACKFRDDKVIENVIFLMIEKGLIEKNVVKNYDVIIRKLCELGRTYAIGMFLDRAYEEKIELNAYTKECMLAAFSKGGSVREAIRIYREIVSRDVRVNESCYIEFANVLCDEDSSEEISGLLKDIIGRGLSPCVSKLSEFVRKQCGKSLWKDAEELVNVMMDKEIVPSSSCCSLLMLRYCNCRHIDFAIALHNKVQSVNGVLDVETYNVLIDGVMKERRAEEASGVFDYMRTRKVMNGESYSIMIRGLCQENELRRAMKMHDEMLEMGLKPDKKAYKRLILCFK